MIITIDGPAGSGKSTVSQLLAKRLQYQYLDTGAMYRAVALQIKRKEIPLGSTEKLRELCRDLVIRFETKGDERRVFIGSEDVSSAIRTPELDLLSSKISAIREVREAMSTLQRRIAGTENLVAEGRDMGTVVFPDAPFKFFITAGSDVRAERRYRERINRGETVLRRQVKSDLEKRDEQDRTRSLAPSIPAKDAFMIDTSSITAEQVVGIILDKIQDRGGIGS